MLKDQLKEDLKQSMLNKDSNKTSTLRMLISAIGYYEIEKGGAGYSATDEDVLTVIQKQVKQRNDSIEQYKLAGRQELVDKEQSEVDILSVYMPDQMTHEEIVEIVKKTIESTGATGIADLGKVMGSVIQQTKGKADGGLVSKIVKDELSS